MAEYAEWFALNPPKPRAKPLSIPVLLKRIAGAHGIISTQRGQAFLSTPTGVRSCGITVLDVYRLEDKGYIKDDGDRWRTKRRGEYRYELTDKGWAAVSEEEKSDE